METTPDNSATLPIALSGRCPACDYDVSSLPSGRCPECGGAFLAPDAETLLRIQRAREAFLERWRWWAAPGWAFTIAVGAGFLMFMAGEGIAATATGGAWLAILALLSVPPGRRTSEIRNLEARVYRAFWLTMAPLLHSIWSIPLAFMLAPLVLPLGLQPYFASVGVLLCLSLLVGSAVALGCAWSGLFESLAITATRMSVRVAALLLLGGVSGFCFLVFVAMDGL